jgi:HD superfamily phosphodiesterase
MASADCEPTWASRIQAGDCNEHHHSSRVYYWGALAGKHRGIGFDPELLYAGAMFHDMGLTHQHSSVDERFEVDGANVARDFLRSHYKAPVSPDDAKAIVDYLARTKGAS